MQRKEKAVELFRQQFNCSQAVFTAYRKVSVLDEESALKLSTVLGAGVACIPHTEKSVKPHAPAGQCASGCSVSIFISSLICSLCKITEISLMLPIRIFRGPLGPS